MTGIATKCLRKIAYPSWTEAEADASRINQEELLGIDELLIPYRCHFDAGHWHNGHVPWRLLRENSGVPAMHRLHNGTRGGSDCGCRLLR